MKNEEIIDRLLLFFGGSLASIEKTLKIANGTLGKFRNYKQGLPRSLITALKKKGLNPEYFLTGEGQPEATPIFQTEAMIPMMAEEGTEYNKDRTLENRIPYYDLDVMAHISESLDFSTEKPAAVLSVPGFGDCFACFPVYGQSMEPAISSGDIIAVAKATQPTHILWGEVYLVITDIWRVVKTVHPGVTEEFIILRSINPAYKGDTNVKKEEIRAMYLVKGIVSRLVM